MNKDKVVELYKDGYTLRHISEMFSTDHHTIKRVLVSRGVEITKRNTKKPYTDEHKAKISVSSKGRTSWSKGLKMNRDFLIKNMKSHLKYDVELEWLSMFDDIEKLKYLNRSLSRRRDCEGFTTKTYKEFIEKFYYDDKFNKLFDEWIKTNDKWIKPSLDHIHAKCNGGGLSLNNLQFISWLENRAKMDIHQDVWDKMKKNINYYL